MMCVVYNPTDSVEGNAGKVDLHTDTILDLHLCIWSSEATSD